MSFQNPTFFVQLGLLKKKRQKRREGGGRRGEKKEGEGDSEPAPEEGSWTQSHEKAPLRKMRPRTKTRKQSMPRLGLSFGRKLRGVSSRCLYQERVINKNRNHILAINYTFDGNFRAISFELYKNGYFIYYSLKYKNPQIN